MPTSGNQANRDEMPRGWEDDSSASQFSDDDDFLDEDAIWTPNHKALPPVVGRYDRETGEPLMHYSDDVVQSSKKDDDFDWTDSEGTTIDIGF